MSIKIISISCCGMQVFAQSEKIPWCQWDISDGITGARNHYNIFRISTNSSINIKGVQR